MTGVRPAASRAAPDDPEHRGAVRATFVPTAAELLAVGLHVTAPAWRGRPGDWRAVGALAGIGLVPLAAGLAALPFDEPTALVLGGFGLLASPVVVPAAVLFRRGGGWLDEYRRRGTAANLRRAHAAGGLTEAARTVELSPAGAGEEAEGHFLFRGWPRVIEVDRVFHDDGTDRGGELLLVTAVADGPHPACFFLPRRAAPGGGAAYERLAANAEAWHAAARGADPADPKYAPPAACRPRPGDPAVRAVLTVGQIAAASDAYRPRPGPADWVRGAGGLAVGAAAFAAAAFFADLPGGLLIAAAAAGGQLALLAVHRHVRGRGWWPWRSAKLVEPAADADPTLTAPATVAVTAEGVRVSGAGFGSFHPWAASAAVRTVSGRGGGEGGEEFACLPDSTGGARIVPRAAFPSDAAFRGFVDAAERLRARAG